MQLLLILVITCYPILYRRDLTAQVHKKLDKLGYANAHISCSYNVGGNETNWGCVQFIHV